MGFLDRKSRVVDFVLTERGRELYAVGRLDFVYFSLLDDGLDYDPYATGTLSDHDREVQVLALPSWEAPFVRDVRDATAPLEPTSHLFAAAADYASLPHVSSPATGSELGLMCDQSRDGASYLRTGTSLAQIDLGVVGEAEAVNPGFIVRVFTSGSGGVTELGPRRDLDGRRAYDPFIAAVIDDEPVRDGPTVSVPASRRAPNESLGKDIRSFSRRPR